MGQWNNNLSVFAVSLSLSNLILHHMYLQQTPLESYALVAVWEQLEGERFVPALQSSSDLSEVRSHGLLQSRLDPYASFVVLQEVYR